MKRVCIEDGRAFIVFPEADPAFPGLTVTARFAPDFLAKCIVVEDDTEVNSGDLYDLDTGTFTPAPVTQVEPSEDPAFTESAAAYTEGVNSI